MSWRGTPTASPGSRILRDYADAAFRTRLPLDQRWPTLATDHLGLNTQIIEFERSDVFDLIITVYRRDYVASRMSTDVNAR